MFYLLISDKAFDNLTYCKPSALIGFTTMQYLIRLVSNDMYNHIGLPDSVAKQLL